MVFIRGMELVRCPDCGEMKPRDQVYFRKSGTVLRCKDDQRKRERDYYARNPGRRQEVARRSSRRARLARILYDGRPMTEDDYQLEFERQDGLCALCPRELGDRADVDHDHETDIYRGLLCRGCNLKLHGDIEWFRRAFNYLARTA